VISSHVLLSIGREIQPTPDDTFVERGGLPARILAAKLNSEHGWQLAESDKESTAKALYAYGYTYDAIAEALSVGKAKVGEWLARTVKDNRDKRDRKVLDMWMSYHTQDEIASATGEALETVKRLLVDGDDSLVQKVLQNQTNHTAAFHLTNFEEPLYNAWRQREKTAGLNHSGNSEVRGWIICSTSTPSLSTV